MQLTLASILTSWSLAKRRRNPKSGELFAASPAMLIFTKPEVLTYTTCRSENSEFFGNR